MKYAGRDELGVEYVQYFIQIHFELSVLQAIKKDKKKRFCSLPKAKFEILVDR
jgi:hypothetical protein